MVASLCMWVLLARSLSQVASARLQRPGSHASVRLMPVDPLSLKTLCLLCDHVFPHCMLFGIRRCQAQRSPAIISNGAQPPLVLGAPLSRSGTQQPHLRRSTTLAQHLQSLLSLLLFINACIDSCRHSFTDNCVLRRSFFFASSFVCFFSAVV